MTTACRAGAAPVALLLALLALVGSVPVLDPAWARRTGLDWWEAGAIKEEYRAGQEVNRTLAQEFEQCRCRQELKERLIEELIGGRVSFEEVTLEFLYMNRSLPGSMELIRAMFPGACDEERVASNVLQYAAGRMTGSLFRRAATAARLEAGFRRYIARLSGTGASSEGPPDRVAWPEWVIRARR
jgi:hypothetical protein